MQFSDVIGQANTKAMLCEMANSDRLPHALLLLGPEGSGKLALAMAFAQYILCESPSDGDSCGHCAQCRKVSKLIHPDVHFSFPTIGSKATSENFLPHWRSAIEENPYQHINQWLQHIGAENKQGNITKEECVNIIRKISLKSFESIHKVLIMWLPEFLGKEGNRLLKMIEEPPENTIFILVAEDQSLILNTILSRCQLISIQPLQDEEVIEVLMDRHGQQKSDAQSIAFLANGSYNEAKQLMSQRENNHARLFLEWMRACYKGNPISMVDWVGEMAKEGRENQKHFLAYALHFLREFTLLKVTGTAQVRLQNAELDTASKMSKVLDLEQIEQLSILFSDCAYAVERNANPKVLFLDASIQMHHIMKNKLSGAYQGLRRANML